MTPWWTPPRGRASRSCRTSRSGGFTPLQSGTLQSVADRLGATPMAVALAWLLHRSPNILLIPGTSSVAHLRENIAAAGLKLPPERSRRTRHDRGVRMG